jgi:hypothetical protein
VDAVEPASKFQPATSAPTVPLERQLAPATMTKPAGAGMDALVHPPPAHARPAGSWQPMVQLAPQTNVSVGAVVPTMAPPHS